MRVTIRDAWDSYRVNVLPRDAPPVQVSECRRAFYAGVWAMVNVNMRIGEDSVGEAEAMGILVAITEECESFSLDVQRGKA